MKYCKVEKGSTYNLYCENSTQPTLEQCVISSSASNGLVEYGSSAPTKNCQFLNNNGYPIKYNNWSCNSLLKGNTYSGNLSNYIALSGGDSYQNKTLYNDGIPYHVLENLRIMYNRVSIQPGVTLAFAPSKNIQVGYSSLAEVPNFMLKEILIV